MERLLVVGASSVKTAGDQYAEAAPASLAPTEWSALQASASARTGSTPPPFVALVAVAAVWQLLQLLSP